MGLGLTIAALGPSLLPLAREATTSVAGMAPVFASRSAGYLLGSLSGPLFDTEWCDGNALVASSLIVAGLGAIVMPLTGDVAAYSALAAMQGLGMGFLDTGANVMTLQLFRKDDGEPDPSSGMALQALHASFAVGAIIAPLVIGGPGDQWRRGLQGIGAYCLALGGVLALWRVASWLGVGKCSRDSDAVPGDGVAEAGTDDDAASDTSGAVSGRASSSKSSAAVSRVAWGHSCGMVAATAALLGLYVGCEASYGGLLVAYSVQAVRVTEQSGADLTAVYWGAIALGRLSGVPLANCVKPRAMITSAVALSVVSAVGLVMAHELGLSGQADGAGPGGDVSTAMWPLVAGIGLGFSVIFPAAIALAETYVPLAGWQATAMVIGAAIGEASLPPIIAAVFEAGGEGGGGPALPVGVLVSILCVAGFLALEVRCGTAAKAELAAAKAERSATGDVEMVGAAHGGAESPGGVSGGGSPAGRVSPSGGDEALRPASSAGGPEWKAKIGAAV